MITKLLSQHLKDDVKQIIAETESLETLEVLTLFLKCNAVKLGKGSKKSRYSASLMKVKNTNGIVTLAEVQHYAAFNERTRTKKEVWLVAVNFFESKVWFGMANPWKFGLQYCAKPVLYSHLIYCQQDCLS